MGKSTTLLLLFLSLISCLNDEKFNEQIDPKHLKGNWELEGIFIKIINHDNIFAGNGENINCDLTFENEINEVVSAGQYDVILYRQSDENSSGRTMDSWIRNKIVLVDLEFNYNGSFEVAGDQLIINDNTSIQGKFKIERIEDNHLWLFQRRAINDRQPMLPVGSIAEIKFYFKKKA